jgi:DNA-binding NtrC family response regulator
MRGRRTVPPPARGARGGSLDEMLCSYEHMLIMETLMRNGFRRALTAEALGISKRRLASRMRALGFDKATLPRCKPGPKARGSAI